MKELDELLGDRISYEDSERRLCIHDVGNLPDVIGISVMDMLVERMPSAVLQPETTEEVAAILKYATKEGIPVTPRAAATSGVMGAVPAKGGIVVEFYRMNRILEVDEENKKVRVQPGVVWAPLEEELNKHGLQLRVYPTSFPSSNVPSPPLLVSVNVFSSTVAGSTSVLNVTTFGREGSICAPPEVLGPGS